MIATPFRYDSRARPSTAIGLVVLLLLLLAPLIGTLAVLGPWVFVLPVGALAAAAAIAKPQYVVALGIFVFAGIYEGLALSLRVTIDDYPLSILDAIALTMLLAAAAAAVRAKQARLFRLAIPMMIASITALMIGLSHGNSVYLGAKDLSVVSYSIIFFVAAGSVASQHEHRKLLIGAFVAGSVVTATSQIASSIGAFTFHISLGALTGLGQKSVEISLADLSLTHAFRDNFLRPSRVLFGLAIGIAAMGAKPSPKWALPTITICFAAAVMSLQRSVWGGLLIILVLTWLKPGLLAGRTRTMTASALVAVTAIGWMVLPSAGAVLAARISESWDIGGDPGITARVSETRSALSQLGGTDFVSGVGLGAYANWYDPENRLTVEESVLHNQYIGVLLKYGVAGFVGLAFIYGPAVRRLASQHWEEAALAASLVAFLIIGIVGGAFGERIIGPLMAAAAGFAIAEKHTEKPTAPAKQSPLLRDRKQIRNRTGAR